MPVDKAKAKKMIEALAKKTKADLDKLTKLRDGSSKGKKDNLLKDAAQKDEL
jgi:hypothetical protein